MPTCPVLRSGLTGGAAGELGRDLDHGLVDEDGDGVEVAGVALEAEALGFEGDGAAAGEGVVEGGQPLRVEQFGRAGVVAVVGAGAAPAPADLGAGLLQDALVGRVLPQHQSPR